LQAECKTARGRELRLGETPHERAVIQQLVSDRTARWILSKRDLEGSEFGLRNPYCVARSPILVGDPFLRGCVPVMGVVEVFPEWPPWFAFTPLP
jgi:hypothetical protein